MSKRYFLGSLNNRMYENTKPLAPEVGMGGTLVMFSDRYPVTIVEIKTSKKIIVQLDEVERIDNNGLSENQEYKYISNENYPKKIFTMRKDGYWVEQGESAHGGTRLVLGERQQYVDPHF